MLEPEPPGVISKRPAWLPGHVLARGPDVCVTTEYVVASRENQRTRAGSVERSRERGHNPVLTVTLARHIAPAEEPEIR